MTGLYAIMLHLHLRGTLLHTIWHLQIFFKLKTRYLKFPCRICDRCEMQAGSTYPSGHLVSSFLWGLAYALIVETRFPESSPMRWPWYWTWPSTNYKRFPCSICDGCGIAAENAYPSKHLVAYLLWGLAYALIWQHKNVTKKIADQLRTVTFSSSSHQTGVVKLGLKGTNLPTRRNISDNIYTKHVY